MSIPEIVDSISAVVANKTKFFVKSWVGKVFLSIILLGPLTFIPTVWEAWTAPNIDALRTITWPLMIVVNLASWLSVIHQGEWRMRIVMLVWTIMISAVWVATLVR